jgi:glycine C-acetyltransferase/8-amino-7-oxononanoate synthase
MTRDGYGRKDLVYFGGCDYFRLSGHPAVVQAIHEGLDEFGLNVAASRITTGNHALYGILEKRICEFFKAPDAVLVSSGYLANLVAAQGLSEDFQNSIMDRGAHTSLVDGSTLISPHSPLFYNHLDCHDLKSLLPVERKSESFVLLTDSVFSITGEVAPISDLLEILPEHSMMLLDESHGVGVMGETGRGVFENPLGSDERVIRSITFSKAFGVYGGAVVGARKWIRKMRENSRIYSGNTPLPLPIVCGILKSLELLDRSADFLIRLRKNIRKVQNSLKDCGFRFNREPVPILSLKPKDEAEAGSFHESLLNHGVYPTQVRYPSPRDTPVFRFALSSEHSPEHLEALVQSVYDAKKSRNS